METAGAKVGDKVVSFGDTLTSELKDLDCLLAKVSLLPQQFTVLVLRALSLVQRPSHLHGHNSDSFGGGDNSSGNLSPSASRPPFPTEFRESGASSFVASGDENESSSDKFFSESDASWNINSEGTSSSSEAETISSEADTSSSGGDGDGGGGLSSDEDSDVPSEYELLPQKRMRSNAAFLVTLGIDEVKPPMRPSQRWRKGPAKKKAAAAAAEAASSSNSSVNSRSNSSVSAHRSAFSSEAKLITATVVAGGLTAGAPLCVSPGKAWELLRRFSLLYYLPPFLLAHPPPLVGLFVVYGAMASPQGRPRRWLRPL
jgi:hypothetical protein